MKVTAAMTSSLTAQLPPSKAVLVPANTRAYIVYIYVSMPYTTMIQIKFLTKIDFDTCGARKGSKVCEIIKSNIAVRSSWKFASAPLVNRA